jgi:hypothetical protein
MTPLLRALAQQAMKTTDEAVPLALTIETKGSKDDFRSNMVEISVWYKILSPKSHKSTKN